MSEELTITQRVNLINEAKRKYDECPNCDEELLGIDHTKRDGMLFIHEENGMFVNGCDIQPEEIGLGEDDSD